MSGHLYGPHQLITTNINNNPDQLNSTSSDAKKFMVKHNLVSNDTHPITIGDSYRTPKLNRIIKDNSPPSPTHPFRDGVDITISRAHPDSDPNPKDFASLTKSNIPRISRYNNHHHINTPINKNRNLIQI